MGLRRNALDEANELIVIGYSLAGTDAASIAVLKSFAEKKKPNQIKLVERDPKVLDRYAAILGLRAEIICYDFANFDPNNL
jgi:hypothetical protein